MNLSKSTPLKFLDAISEDEEMKERILDGETESKASAIYAHYKTWCSDTGERCLTSTKFGTIISTKLEKRRTKNGLVYKLE